MVNNGYNLSFRKLDIGTTLSFWVSIITEGLKF